MTSIFSTEWSVIDTSLSGPLVIATGQNDDLATVYSDADSTVNISRYEAIRAAKLMATAPELAACLEQLIDIVVTDRDFARGYAPQIEAAEKVLSRAYGATD